MLMTAASMRDYFRECLSTALKKTNVKITDTAQVYVVNLLAEFGRAENVYAGTDAGERPVLVELLSRAHEAEPQEAVRIYKHMGDSSLYHSGFFKESVERHGRDYYVSMGGSAYASVADLMRPTAASSSALFMELADRFPALCDLLDAMSLHGASQPDVDNQKVLALVARFERTGDRAVLDALKAQGIVMRPGVDADDDDDVN
jgi:hypothetical protein